MGRNVSSGSLVRAQVDLYSPPGSVNRAVGVQALTMAVKVFANNSPLPWTVADGTSVPDSSISAGTVYFNEIPNAPGYYSLRFFPDRVGFWRLSVRSTSIDSESVLEFDVNAPSPPAGGLNATFTK